MLFNSYEYIFLFLPVTLLVYFALNLLKKTYLSRAWLIVASLFFYSWWDIHNLPIILASICVNYFIGLRIVNASGPKTRNLFFLTGLSFNVLLLMYYKYTDFLLTNINAVFGSHFELLHKALPLGISFFTITQIAYLFDANRQTAREYNFANYALFVSFFPHLLAGPILHHKEMMPQFDRLRNKVFNPENLSKGLVLLSIGIIKKVLIADHLAVWADNGFDVSSSLTMVEAWITSLSYTFQIYFDFSGYTDMALGAALLFNIHLPLNFNSPYKAVNIQDFWRRWHMTLSRFLRDYIYIPLGGNRRTSLRTNLNIFITFVIGGIWHGAGWGFLIWGILHGVAYMVHRFWQDMNIKVGRFLAIFLTFNFVNLTWLFFRAKSLKDAVKVLKGMFGLNGSGIEDFWNSFFSFLVSGMSLLQEEEKFRVVSTLLGYLQGSVDKIFVLLLCLIVCLFAKNSNERVREFIPSWNTAFMFALGTIFAILAIKIDAPAKFLYFDF